MGSSRSSETRVRAAWEADRAYLLAIATGMLRQPVDAEDVVQEAFSRLAAAPPDAVNDVRGWLVVVTRRLCLDRLGSAEARRTTSAAALPDAGPTGVDPADRMTLDDDVRRALTVVIDRLSPPERTSFILHDVFGFPFDAIAELVGRTPSGCRQLARRARLQIRSQSFEPDSSAPRSVAGAELELAETFIAACEGGNVRRLVDLLDPDVAGQAVVIGMARPPVVRGAQAVAERVLWFFGPDADVTLEPFTLDGQAGVIARRRDKAVAVLRLDHRDGKIHHVHSIAKPLMSWS
jgi:RNA polymerase sigma-70 factor (ECF subfamily)